MDSERTNITITTEHSDETRLALLEGKMKDIVYELYGNGKPGLVKNLADHMHAMDVRWSNWDQREQDKMKYDDRQEKRAKKQLAWIVALTGIATLLVTLLLYEHETHSTLLQGRDSTATYATFATERTH
jgi:hypothetical protein